MPRAQLIGVVMQEDRIISQGIRLFENVEFGQLRTANDNGATMFCGRDVAAALGCANTNKAIADHCRGVTKRYPIVDSLGRTQEAVFITEADVLRLIVSSKLPAAQAYERWVFEDVLPSIRKTGGYMVARDDETPMETVSRALLIAKDALDRKEARIAQLEADGIMKDAEIARIAPKAAFTDKVLDNKGTYTVTEAARLLKQVDPSMGQKKLFGLLRSDSMLEKHSNKATALAVERGYLYNFIPSSYEDPITGEKKLRDPYARVTSKGLKWMNQRYCKPNPQTSMEVVA